MRLIIGDLHHLSVQADPNQYVSGWMPSKDPHRPHRVVSALQVHDGTRNASALCADMARSFPELRVFVMCGIAGGVPLGAGTGADVRLGDVLVATEGIVDYDHVRTVDGENVLRRSVEGLSKALLRADRELEVKSFLGEEPWHGPLSDTAERVDSKRWLPTSDPPESGGESLVPSADRQGRSGLPRVHRGAIGSADRLLRDAVLRDSLAARHRLLGVEMEGSGIAVGADLHDRRWFMVRGVADYCDNRTKNDDWHPYASLAAAAYVGALLAECPPFGAAVRRASGPGPLGGFQAIVDGLLDLQVFRDDYQRRAVLAQLPEGIRTAVPDNVVARLHVIGLVRTCEDFPDGRDALLDVLRLAIGADAPEFRRIEVVIQSNWSDS